MKLTRHVIPAIIVLISYACSSICIAQQDSVSEFEKLSAQGRSVHDSLPARSQQFFLQALKASKGQSVATMAWLYNEIGSTYQMLGDYDSSLIYYRKGLRLALAAGHVPERLSAYQGIADDLRNLSQKDSAHHYLSIAMALAKDHRLFVEEAGLHSDLGNVYRDEEDLQQSLNHYIRAATLYDSTGSDQVGLSRALGNIANVHYLLKNYDKALTYVDQSNVIAIRNSYFRGIAYNHKLAGRIFRQKKDIPKALQEYNAALAAYQKNGDQYSMSETLLGIGNLRYDQKDYNGAITDYQRSMVISRSIDVKLLMAYAYSAMGFAYYSLAHWPLATAYMDSARVAAIEAQAPYLLMDAYQILASVEEEQHHYENALGYLYQYTNLKDSLGTAENRQAIEDAEAKYQNDRKTAEIALLQKDQQVQAATLLRNRVLTVGIGTALIAVIIIGYLVFNRYRILNASRRQLEMERMRNTIARDLHDDIGSTLSSINIISQVALWENGHAPATAPHFQRIHDHSARIMESMSDIVWSIDPGNDSVEKVVAKMNEFCGEILEPRDIAYALKNVGVLEGILPDLESRKNLFLIFKEIVNNAAKYSGANNVTVTFDKNEKHFTMEISDNGKGFDRGAIRRGNGLNNMAKRAESMRARIDIVSAPGHGTHIVLRKDIT